MSKETEKTQKFGNVNSIQENSPSNRSSRRSHRENSFRKNKLSSHPETFLQVASSQDEVTRQKNEIHSKSQNISFTTEQNGADKLEELSIWQQLDIIVKRIRFKKYLKGFLLLSRLRLQRLLTPQQLYKINDKSQWINDQNDIKDANRSCCIIGRRSLRIIPSLPVFLPNSKFIEVWSAVKIICVLVCFIAYLICFSFGVDIGEIFNKLMLVGCQSCLILDILVHSNTGIYIKGVLCINREKIFDYYKSSQSFYYDSVSTSSILLYYVFYFFGLKHKYMTILLLPIVFKQNDINIAIKKMKEKFLLDKKTQNFIELCNLLKNIFLISHVFACIWIFVGQLSDCIDFTSLSVPPKIGTSSLTPFPSWIKLMDLEHSSWLIQYLYAYYFITVTMITVGYGDIRPTNPLEVVVCIFLMLFCCVIFGFTINSIGQIFEDIFSQEKRMRLKRCIIGNYMKRNEISAKTTKNVFEYLEQHMIFCLNIDTQSTRDCLLLRYYWKEQNDENSQEEQTILTQLSDSLKEQLLLEQNKIVLNESKILRKNFSKQFLEKCIPIIQEQRFTPGELVIDEKSGNVDCCIFFVLSGTLEEHHRQSNLASIQKNSAVIQSISKGGSFGEKHFFSGEKASLNVESVGNSKLLKIRRDDFIKIAMLEKEEYEKFCLIQDQINFCSDIANLYLTCSCCSENTHEASSCPVMHFTPRKAKILAINEQSIPHHENGQRTNLSRKAKINSLEEQQNNQECLKNFVMDYDEELNNYEELYFCFDLNRKSLQVDLGSIREDVDSTERSLKQLQKSPTLSSYFRNSSKKKYSGKQHLNSMFLKKTIKRTSFMFSKNHSLEMGDNNCVSSSNISSQSSSEQDEQKGIDNLQQFEQKSSDYQGQEKHVHINPITKEGNLNSENKSNKLADSRLNSYNKKSSILQQQNRLQQRYCDFDYFQGKFEKQSVFNIYYPKYNLKNVLKSFTDQMNKKIKMYQVENTSSPHKKAILSQSNFGKNQYNLEVEDNEKKMGSPFLTNPVAINNRKSIYYQEANNFFPHIDSQNIQVKRSSEHKIMSCSPSFCPANNQSSLDVSPQRSIDETKYFELDEPLTPPRKEEVCPNINIAFLSNPRNIFSQYSSLDRSSFLQKEKKI